MPTPSGEVGSHLPGFGRASSTPDSGLMPAKQARGKKNAAVSQTYVKKQVKALCYDMLKSIFKEAETYSPNTTVGANNTSS